MNKTKLDYAGAASTNVENIPVIDIADLVKGEVDGLNRIAREIHDAATRIGFFYISNHGISPDLILQAQSIAQEFFALPDMQKEEVTVDASQRGWMKTGMAHMEGAATHDLKEVFFWGAEVSSDDPDLLAGKPLVAQNRWPDQSFPRLRAELTPYYQAVCRVGDHLLGAIAVALGQDQCFFEDRYKSPLARGQMVYYPPSAPEDEQAQRFGVAPHTDFGMLTLLLQDHNGGLQVQDKQGDWIEAPPIENTIVCNIGDLLQRWSNDRYVSTVHRVINRSGNPRYSVPVFYDPNTSAVVDPRDLGVSNEDAKHAPVTAGEHIMGRNRRNFSQYKVE